MTAGTWLSATACPTGVKAGAAVSPVKPGPLARVGLVTRNGAVERPVLSVATTLKT